MVSCVYRLSYLLSSILRPVIQSSEYACDSTEDMDLSSSIVGSMDVVALYPNIWTDFSVDKCAEMIEESEMVFDSVNVDELGMFLIAVGDEQVLKK